MLRRNIFQVLFVLVLTSCSSSYKDYTTQFKPISISNTVTGAYINVAWINEDTIVAIIDRGNVFKDNKMCVQEDLVALSTKSRDSQLIDLQLDKDCMVYSISSLQELPNNKIGYLYSTPNQGQEISVIRQLEIKDNNYQLSQERRLTLDQFTYSPNMKEVAATRVKGIDESNIFLIKDNRKEIDISPGFARAELAAWSRDNVIAFFGTKVFEKEKEPFIQLYSFDKYLFYPWQLYLYNPDTAEIIELSIEVVDPGELKWSPDLQKLAFRGEINNIKGVWIVDNLDDPKDLQVSRIIDAEATFDFSPDGKSIVFAYIGLQNQDRQNILYKVDLPEQVMSTK